MKRSEKNIQIIWGRNFD